jgi:hypothetical protein
MFCIPGTMVEKFKAALKSGVLDPFKLAELSSDERRSELEKYFGINAKNVNRLFEQKLLMKDQQAALVNWAKEVAGMKPAVLKDFVSRVERMTDIVQPGESEAFLADLAEHKLGVTVTRQEAGKITDLAADASEKKLLISEKTEDGSPEALAYGRARVALSNYVSELKNEAKAIKPKDWVERPVQTIGRVISEIPGIAKSIAATGDNSVLLRQGMKVLFAEPKIWAKNAVQSFVDIVKTFKGYEVKDEVMADILSRKNMRNGLYSKEKLAIGVTEEAYPSSLPEKLPGVFGKLFKASEAAFVAFQYRTRADIFDKYVRVAEKMNLEIDGIGEVINSITGRGSLGSFEGKSAETINKLFFSARYWRSNVDILTGNVFMKDKGAFANKKSIENTRNFYVGMAISLAIAQAIGKAFGIDDTIEFDPRSSDFGKVKVGNTRFEVTGGAAANVTLLARIFGVKSSTTGVVKKLSKDFGATDYMEVLENFTEGKASPSMSIMIDLARMEDREGNDPSVLGEMKRSMPMIISSAVDGFNSDEAVATKVAIPVLDSVGIGGNARKMKPSKIVSSASSVKKEIKRLRSIGNDKEADKLETRNQKLMDQAADLKSSVESIRSLEREIKKVKERVDTTPAQKKAELKALEAQLKEENRMAQ